MPPQENMSSFPTKDEHNSNEVKCFTNPVYVPDTFEGDKKSNDEVKIKQTLEFDDLLPQIGEFGIYQRVLFLLMIPFAFFVAWVYFSQIFITIVPEHHWCWVPELANLTVEARYVVDLFLFLY